jgi:hypothetical protein
MLLRLHSCSAADSGSVTAELALALPSVALVLSITLAGFGLQVERLKLVSAAATASRALARGEAESEIQNLIAQIAPESKLKFEYLDNFVCTRISQEFEIASLSSFEVDERQCYRKNGL